MERVLVIEDNKVLRENTAELLSLNGYGVITACNGLEGFKMTKKNKPNVILCDILMPQTDGKAFLKLVKQDKTTSSIPLIFFSAGSAPPEVKNGLMQGADEYLSKPFTEDELMNAVKRSLEKC
jgi:CheY-like chemotaxis protein